MSTFINASLLVHVSVGCIALLSGLGAILFRNKVKIHKKFGIVYFYSMTAVFITAVYISVFKGNVFLFCVAFFTYYSCLTAFRSLKLKRLHVDQKPGTMDWAIEGFFGMMHVGFVVFAIYIFTQGNTAFGIIAGIFGIIGLRGNQLNIKRLRGNLKYRNYWLLAHIGGMLGSYIGAVTAFFVNNNNRFIHLPDLVAWLGPAVFIAPLIFYELNRHQKKAGKFDKAKA
jgi:uncharacterized membrane protein